MSIRGKIHFGPLGKINRAAVGVGALLLTACGSANQAAVPANSQTQILIGRSLPLALMPRPFDPRIMRAIRGVLPIPAAALKQFPHFNPVELRKASGARVLQNTGDNDGGGQSGFIVNPGTISGDGGIYVAMTAYDDAWVTTPTDGSYNTVNAPTTHGPNGNCIETVTNYYNGFGTPGTTVDQVQFYDFCANNGQGGFVGAIQMDAAFVSDYVRTYADPVRPMPRYISVVEYSSVDLRYHAYLYNASLMQYVDYYDSAPGATTNANGSEGWSIYETHYHGGDCTALPDASEEALEVHTATGWQLLAGNQVSSYLWGTCFSAPFTDPYNVPVFSTSPSVAWTVTSPVSPALSAYARVLLADAPIVYYRLGDTTPVAIDSGGSNLNGTDGANVGLNAPSLLASESLNGSASFRGGTSTPASFVSVASSTLLQPPTSVSVEAWVEESQPATATSDLVAYGSSATGLSYSLQVLANNTLAGFATTSSGYGLVSGKTVLSPHRSYLADITYNGSQLSLYVDGVLDSSSNANGSLTYAPPNTSDGLSIGSANNSTRPVFSGTLDEAAVFGTPLTTTQIAAHWTAGSGVAIASAVPEYTSVVQADAPIAFYQLNDASRVAADSGPNKISGAYGSSVATGVTGLLTTEPTYTAAKFPGGPSNVNVAITTPRNSKLEPKTAVSIEGWLNLAAYNAATIDVISYGPEKLGQPYTLQLFANGTVGMYVLTKSGYGFVQGVTALSLNTPHLIDGTYNGTAMQLFVDGALDASQPASGALNYSKESVKYGLSIGTAYDTARPAFNGLFDDVAVYGAALSGARVAAHWTAGSGHALGP